MLATIKVLGIRARSRQDIARAAGAIRRYVEEGMTPSIAGYYTSDAGLARGSAAALLGMAGVVSPEQLERLLAGEHPALDAALLSARGSAARAMNAPGPSLAPGTIPPPHADSVTLVEAARLAGVSRRYLTRLIAETPEMVFPTASGEVDPRVAAKLTALLTNSPVVSPGRDYLAAVRGESGEWRVSRGELGRFLAERQPPETVLGFDLTLAAPKSVSLLWAFGPETLRQEIAAAVDASVDVAVAYLESQAAVGKIGGRNTFGRGFAVASYRHEWSRNDDPHLHIHNVIVNAVPIPLVDADGRPVLDDAGVPRIEWRALDGTLMLRHRETAGYLAAAELRVQLARRLGVEWGPTRRGLAEIASFPDELLQAFSTRHRDVVVEYHELLDKGVAPGKATEAMAQRGSRRAKHGPVDASVALARLAELGWSPDEIVGLVPGLPRPTQDLDHAAVGKIFNRMAGPVGVTERQALFDRRHVICHLANLIGGRVGASEIETLADRFLADERVVLCAARNPSRRGELPEASYTTINLLRAEAELLEGLTTGPGATAHHAAVPVAVVRVALDNVNASLQVATGSLEARLDHEQSAMVEQLCLSRDRVRIVHGPAGTGKTEALRAAVGAWTAAGVPVVATANGGSQAEDLGERLEVRSEVVASWLTRLAVSHDPSMVWAPGTVVLIDEATQVSTREMADLVRWAQHTDAVLVAVGDPAQISSVGAGGWFIHAVEDHPVAASLTALHRQHGDSMAEVRAALTDLRSSLPKQVAASFDRLARDGRVQVFDTREDLLRQVVDDWYADRIERMAVGDGSAPKVSRMMASNHRDVEALNEHARARLTTDDTLAGPELEVGGRSFQVGDEVVTLTQAGHPLRPAGAGWRNYIRTGTTGTVAAVHLDEARPERQHLVVDFGRRGEVEVDWDYLTHSFDDGRAGGLAHAYAYTAARAQGATMRAARAVIDDTTSRAATYVMASRGELDLCAYLVRRGPTIDDPHDERWLPVLPPSTATYQQVLEHLQHSTGDRLVTDDDPLLAAAQRLAAEYPVAELAAMRRAAADGQQALYAQAERIAVERLCADTRAFPADLLVAHLGLRPEPGERRRVWDAAVDAVTDYQARWRPSTDTGHWAIGPRLGEGDRIQTSAWESAVARIRRAEVQHLARTSTADELYAELRPQERSLQAAARLTGVARDLQTTRTAREHAGPGVALSLQRTIASLERDRAEPAEDAGRYDPERHRLLTDALAAKALEQHLQNAAGHQSPPVRMSFGV